MSSTKEKLSNIIHERKASPEEKAKYASARLITVPKLGNFLILKYHKNEYVAHVELDNENKRLKLQWISDTTRDISEIGQQFAGNIVNQLQEQSKKNETE
jgi:hypothetical protein